ncbi:MAG: glutamine--tRNA ligase/YqeY domain fusion protein [Oligoflexales bacterium]|nr:glutamine--tRNA ligase/YqeY domain fusion protein [Oligoflexales bacterium]
MNVKKKDGENKQQPAPNFIRHLIDEERARGQHPDGIITRFPPEPNGFLHIGHAKSICLNFSLASEYPNSHCNLRFDDTNPSKEDTLFIEAIKEDVRWLGFSWHGKVRHASDYFDKIYDYSVQLIKMGKAYVCGLNQDELRLYRGTLKEAGRESPDRKRSIEENLDLFERMKKGEFEDGRYVLRAKIDMNSGNINMRDPVMYRIMKHQHPITKDLWCIYPMYDYTHCLSDALEGITHSLCTLEFEDHRPLYDWFLDTLKTEFHPRQIEFARLNLSYTVMSKRKLKQLVEEGHVTGWDDPRMPSIVGFRRRGYTPKAIRDFCERIGLTKKESSIDMGYLEECLREDLNRESQRAFCVTRPLKLVITNYPEDQEEILKAPLHPQQKERGDRELPLSREIYIEQDDFMEAPSSDFFRLGPGRRVRLRYGYIISCEDFIKDAEGHVVEVRCTYDPHSLGKDPEGPKVRGIIHWVSVARALTAELRLYDRLFSVEDPSFQENEGVPFTKHINPKSLEVLTSAKIEPSLKDAAAEDRFQFERLGFFCVDKDSRPGKLVFNRTVTLKETWVKPLPGKSS